jgi:hypothetical protein
MTPVAGTVHWPSDVVAGWLFAEAWLQLAQALSAGDGTSRARAGITRVDLQEKLGFHHNEGLAMRLAITAGTSR